MSQRAYSKDDNWTSSRSKRASARGSGSSFSRSSSSYNRSSSSYNRSSSSYSRSNSSYSRGSTLKNRSSTAKAYTSGSTKTKLGHATLDNQGADKTNGVNSSYAKKGRVINSAMKKPVYILRKDNKAKISALTLITIAIIFAGGMGMAITSAAITDRQAKRAEMQNEIKTLQEINNGLRAEVSQTMKIDDVERIAISELGMIRPRPYQIINLDVEKQSYVVQNPEFGKNTKKGFSLRSLLDMIKIRIES